MLTSRGKGKRVCDQSRWLDGCRSRLEPRSVVQIPITEAVHPADGKTVALRERCLDMPALGPK
jgi:hypothetical protein